MQATGLLHLRLRLPRRGRWVERHGLGGEEAVGVDVGAAQPDLVDSSHDLGRGDPQRQVGVAYIVLVLPVDHGPLVESEAPGHWGA